MELIDVVKLQIKLGGHEGVIELPSDFEIPEALKPLLDKDSEHFIGIVVERNPHFSDQEGRYIPDAADKQPVDIDPPQGPWWEAGPPAERWTPDEDN